MRMGLDLRGDDFHMGRETQLVEQLLAVFPSEAEGTYIRNPETGDRKGKCLGIPFGELTVIQCALRPIHQLVQGDLVVKIGGDLSGDGLFRDRHDLILDFLVAFIYRELFVRLDPCTLVVVNFLPEA